MKWFTSFGSEAGLGGLPTGKGEGESPSNRFVGMEAPVVFCLISPMNQHLSWVMRNEKIKIELGGHGYHTVVVLV